MSKFGKLAAVAATATALVAIAGSPASAADTAYNTRNVYLDGAPVWSDPDACVSRSMTVASGWYTWTQIFEGTRNPSRDLYLAAGTYTWTDCIRAWDGYYEQKSSLSKPGSATAVLNDTNLHFSAGTYHFGSLLDPHF
ncbi:hypothetical protein [Streptomyces sp. NBC_01353]|uniref:hypothetical protein n=1 Tax=Streptomyces sp. NBC_01353 TaxID=2903835 RepID=UPI002E37D786|nr:hypothetical protein [Streptomyces sp. NBC_01353]